MPRATGSAPAQWELSSVCRQRAVRRALPQIEVLANVHALRRCVRIGTGGMFHGAIWGHRRLPVRRKALLGSRRCQAGAGSENTVRRVLRRLAGERGTFASVVDGPVRRHRRSRAGAERCRLRDRGRDADGDRHVVGAGDTAHARPEGGAERRARAPARISDRRAANCRGSAGASARRRAVVFRRNAMVRRTAGRAVPSVARDGEHSGRAR